MKKLIIILTAVLMLTACKKDRPDGPSIKGTWNLVNIVANTYESDILTDTETVPGAGTTYDFQDNGTLLVTSIDNGTESFTYSIEPDNKIKLDGQLLEVKNLTDYNVMLSFRDVFSADIYTDIAVNLKR